MEYKYKIGQRVEIDYNGSGTVWLKATVTKQEVYNSGKGSEPYYVVNLDTVPHPHTSKVAWSRFETSIRPLDETPFVGEIQFSIDK